MQVAEELFYDLCLGTAARDQLADPREPHRYERKLDGGEEAVQSHEYENAYEA
jgi:hypothetical protein